jgi:hypothetical protein
MRKGYRGRQSAEAERALRLIRNRPIAEHLRGTGEMSASGKAVAQAQRNAGRWPSSLPAREPARSARGGDPVAGRWNTAPPAHVGHAGTQNDARLTGQSPALRSTNMYDGVRGVYEGPEYGATPSSHLRRMIAARRGRTAQAR